MGWQSKNISIAASQFPVRNPAVSLHSALLSVHGHPVNMTSSF
jgi:hypothetical protein